MVSNWAHVYWGNNVFDGLIFSSEERKAEITAGLNILKCTSLYLVHGLCMYVSFFHFIID